jgi:diguanylate cyclase (GGDEF)-like protein
MERTRKMETLAPSLPTSANVGSILLAEDSAVYRHLIRGHFADWGFDFECVNDGKEAWKILSRKDAPRLALLDWVLPEIDGIELCRRLRARSDEHAYTYTILLTGKNRKEEMLEAMEAGVDDFLAKPFDPLELKARLHVGKRIVELQQKLFSANRALHFAASHDFLTGAWNRAEIVAFLQRELSRARRDGTPLGLILVDVDHFKKVNDQFGHETGDQVLRGVSECLSASLRSYDGVGRYGGEEFLVVMPDCDLTTSVRRANEIRESVSAHRVSAIAGEIAITVSMGVAVAEDALNCQLFLRRADDALYRAKNNGRNRVEYSTASENVAAC